MPKSFTWRINFNSKQIRSKQIGRHRIISVFAQMEEHVVCFVEFAEADDEMVRYGSFV